MFNNLTEITRRPSIKDFMTSVSYWNDEYVSKKIMEMHLNPANDIISRNYDIVNRSIEWIIKYFNINPNTKICDLGCGIGLYASEFAKIGAQVTGIDFSRCSIDYAEEEAIKCKLKIKYYCDDYLSINLKDEFDLITFLYCDYCVLNPAQRKTLLNKIKLLLKNKGLILFDVFSIHYFNEALEASEYSFVDKNGFWSPEPYFYFLNIFKYDKDKIILNKETIITKYKEQTINNWLQCFDLETIKMELELAGMVLCNSFSNICGGKYCEDSFNIAVVASNAN